MSRDYYKGKIQGRINRLNNIDTLIKRIKVGLNEGYDGKLADFHTSIEFVDSALMPILNDDGSQFAESGLTLLKGNIVHSHDIVTNYKDVNYKQTQFISILKDEKSKLEAEAWQLQREYNNNKDPLDVIGIKLMELYKVNLV